MVAIIVTLGTIALVATTLVVFVVRLLQVRQTKHLKVVLVDGIMVAQLLSKDSLKLGSHPNTLE